jgi:hypothetical protein
LAVDPLMDGRCSHGPAVDPVYGPRWTGLRGVTPRSNLRRPLRIGRLASSIRDGRRRAHRRGAARGGARRRLAGGSPATIQNGLPGTVLSLEGLYAERGTRRTRPRALEGGSGDGEGTTAGEAGGAGSASGRRCCGSGKNKRRRGEACSPPRQRVGDGSGTGEAAVVEIDVGVQRLKMTAAATCAARSGNERAIL